MSKWINKYFNKGYQLLYANRINNIVLINSCKLLKVYF